jgi:hypothetical protein
MLKNEETNTNKCLFGRMQEEIGILSNISFILKKLNSEGFLNQIEGVFQKILKNEIKFAIKGKNNENFRK